MSDFRIGDRVKVTARNGGVFYSFNEGEAGTVSDITGGGGTIWVLFDHNHEQDYGVAEDLELLVSTAPVQVAKSVPSDESIAAKLRLLETTIEEIKVALGLRSAV